MSREKIEQKVSEVIRNVMENKSIKLVDESRILDDLQIDSMTTVMLMNDLEDEFTIKIGDDEFDNVKTVKEITEFVKKRVAETPLPLPVATPIPMHSSTSSSVLADSLDDDDDEDEEEDDEVVEEDHGEEEEDIDMIEFSEEMEEE